MANNPYEELLKVKEYTKDDSESNGLIISFKNRLNSNNLNIPLYTNYPLDMIIENKESTSSISKPITFDLQQRTSGVTFETLLRNIASYKYEVDLTNNKNINKKYYLENNKIINVNINSYNKDNIVITISGDTGYNKNLIKIIKKVNNKREVSYE